jgi:hypothetical protein
MHYDRKIPAALQSKVNHELEAGETLAWIQMPIPYFFTKESTVMFLFSIPWNAFVVFWICGAAGFKVPYFSSGFGFEYFPVFGVPFLFVGIAMLLAPLWTYRKALRTVYVISDRRAITFDGGWTTTIRSYPPDKLTDVYRKERRDGTGDVVIARRVWRDAEGDRQSEELGFLRINNPKQVEQLLNSLARKRTERTRNL